MRLCSQFNNVTNICFLAQIPKKNCTNQEDIFDSEGVYRKTICSLKYYFSKNEARSACESLQMQMASADNLEQGEAILAYRASKEYTTAVIWIGGEINGKCSVISSLSTGNFIRTWRTCSDSAKFHAFCEFNGEINVQLHEP